jgi:hypothetical protein
MLLVEGNPADARPVAMTLPESPAVPFTLASVNRSIGYNNLPRGEVFGEVNRRQQSAVATLSAFARVLPGTINNILALACLEDGGARRLRQWTEHEGTREDRPVVKNLTELPAGTIAVQSRIGERSLFTAICPRQQERVLLSRH